jgi:DNA-binding GntR family transcriptional regulator
VSRSTLREAQQILVHEGLLVSSLGGRQFRDRSVAEHRQGPQHDVNIPLPLQRIEPHLTLLMDEETTAAAEDAAAAALGIAPGENVFRRRRTYGVSGRTLAVARRDGLRRRTPSRGPPCRGD